MNIGTGRLSCEQAKQIDMVDYLASLGYNPEKIKNDDYWYNSPLRDERLASFKINRKNNVWYDHGTGQGGNIVDFGILYHKCSVSELLDKLNSNLSFHPPKQKVSVTESHESSIQLLSEGTIVSLFLLRYLKQRRIAEAVARRYCKEISFSTNGKVYTAIGFKNDQGGFELRNQWYKGSIAPKAVTSIENGSKELAVFEGFFDFLSHQTIHQNQPSSGFNFLVLNSTSFFEKSRELMEQHERIRLFLDRDKSGQNCIQQALSWSARYRDESSLYKGYKDLNEWMQNIGKSLKRGMGQSR
jgi:hypothetical protein